MKPSRALSLAVLAISAVLLTPSTQACDDQVAAAAPKAPESPKPPAPAAGAQVLPRMVVTRDKETGRLRAATADEIRTLAASPRAALLSAAESPVVTTLPDGTKLVDLTDRYFSMAVAKKGADGTIRQRCVESEKERSEFLSAAAPAAPAKPVGTADEK